MRCSPTSRTRRAGATSARAMPRRCSASPSRSTRSSASPVRSRTYVRYTELFRWPLSLMLDRHRVGAACSSRGRGRCHDDADAAQRRGRAAVAADPRASCCRSSFFLLLRRARRQRARRLQRLGHLRHRAPARAGEPFSAGGGWRAARLGAAACSPASRSPVRDGAWSEAWCARAASTWCSRSTRRSR